MRTQRMVTSPSHWLTQHTFIALCPSSSLECISWRVGPTCLANTCRYQHTHSLSLFLCVCRGVCVHVYQCVRDREFGRYEQLQVWSLFCFGSVFFFFLGGGGGGGGGGVQKSHWWLTLYVSCCNSPIFSQFDFCGYCCWSVIRINTAYTSKIIIWYSSHTCFTLTDTTRYLLSSLEIIGVAT